MGKSGNGISSSLHSSSVHFPTKISFKNPSAWLPFLPILPVPAQAEGQHLGLFSPNMSPEKPNSIYRGGLTLKPNDRTVSDGWE